MAEIPDKPSWWRSAILTLCSVAAAYALYSFGKHPPLGVFLVCGLLVASPLLNRSTSLGPQLVARAVWWQAGFLGVLTLAGDSLPVHTAALLAGSGLGAALVAGRIGLENTSASFLPVAFRRTLMLSLIFAIADFEALLFYGSLSLEHAVDLDSAWFLGSAGAMGVSIFGLYRLKLWGLAACVLTNIVVATLALTHVFDLPDILTYGLAATAVLQLLLPIPLVRQMVSARRLA